MGWVEVLENQPKGGRWVEKDTDLLSSMGYTGQHDTELNKALTSALVTAPVRVAEGILSAIDMVNDLASGRPEKMKNNTLRNTSLYLRDWADKKTPAFEEGSAAYYTYSVVSNVIQNAPWIAAGIASGGTGLIPILGMGATVAGEKYNELRQSGYDDTTAKLAATGYGVAEAIGEKISIGSLLKFAKFGMLKNLLSYTVKEIPSEIATEVMQAGIDVGYLNEDMSWSDFARRIKDVAIVTGISTPLMAGMGRGMGYTAQKMKGKPKPVPGINPATNVTIAPNPFAETSPTLSVAESVQEEVTPPIPETQNEQQTQSRVAATADMQTTTSVSYEDFIEQETGEKVETEQETEEWLRPSNVIVKSDVEPTVQHVKQEKTIKQIIKEVSGQTRVDTLVPEMQALNAAMKKAEIASREAYRAGNKEGTLTERAKRQAMAQALKVRQALQKETTKLKGYLQSGVKNANRMGIPPEYRDVVKAIGENLDGAAVEALLRADETLLIHEDQIAALKETHWDGLTLDQLRNAVSVMKQIVYQGRKHNQIVAMNQKYNLDTLADEMAAEAEATFDMRITPPIDVKQAPTGEEPPLIGEKKTFYDKVKDVGNSLLSQMTKVEYFNELLDGYKKNGIWWRTISQRMADAETASIKRSIAIRKQLDSAIDLIRPDLKRIMTEKYSVAGIKITKENAIMVALNAVHPDNLRNLMHGNRLSYKQITEIVESLTDNEKRFVNAILDLVGSQGKEISDVYRRMTGERMKIVEGTYFPIQFDKSLSEKHAEREATKNMLIDVVSKAAVGRGFTISRVKSMIPLKLSFDVITDHLGATNLFVTHGEAVKDVMKIIGHPVVKGAIKQAIGESAYAQYPLWLKGIANPHYEAMKGWDTIAGILRKNATLAILGFSLSVTLLQPTAYFNTINRLGFGKALGGAIDFYRHWYTHADEIKRLSPYMHIRAENFDVELRRIMEEDSDPAWQPHRMKRLFYSMISWADRMATMPTWWATYQNEMRQSGDETLAVQMADKMVRQTQASASPKDLAEIQRGNNTRKAFVMFYSYFSSVFNEMNKSVHMVKTGKAGFSEIMKSTWWLILLPAMLSTFLRDREKLWEDEDGWIELVKGIPGYAASTIPLVGTFANALFEGYSFRPSPLINIPQEAIWTFTAKDLPKFMKHGTMLIGYLFGLPSRQAILTAEAIWEVYDEGEYKPGNLVYKERKKGGHR